MRLLPVFAVVAVTALAGCATGGHVQAAYNATLPTSSPSPAESTASETALAVATAARTECAAEARVWTMVHAFAGLAPMTIAADMDAMGSLWSRQLTRASSAADASGVPDGRNRARTMAVTLGKEALAVDFGDIDYDQSDTLAALKAYTKFIKMLKANAC